MREEEDPEEGSSRRVRVRRPRDMRGEGGVDMGSTPGGDPVCSSRADLDHAADVGNPHCHGAGAAAPEALCRVRIQSHILGALQQVERGVGKWAGGGTGRRGGARSSGGGKGWRGGDKRVGKKYNWM